MQHDLLIHGLDQEVFCLVCAESNGASNGVGNSWRRAGCPDGPDAISASLVARCKENLVEPRACLRDIFARLKCRPTGEDLATLLPNRWLVAHPTHRWHFTLRRREERHVRRT